MRIDANRLKAAAAAANVSPEQLADSLPREASPKQERSAVRKVRNWLAGRDQPRCKPAEMKAMAQALGVQPKDIARFTCTYRFARGSWRKVGLITELIRGRRVDEADALLQFSPRRGAKQVRKALKAAIADAEQADAAVDRLFVAEARVGPAVRIKRFQPKDRGRAHPILKRTSHIVVGVAEAPARS